MSKLEELINKLCPNGVEFKTLGDIATYRRGSFPQPYTNTSFYGGEDAMPFVQVADIEDDGFKLKDKTKQTISKIAQPKSIFVPKGTVICSIQGTIGRVAITQYDSYVDRTIAIFESLNNKIDKKFFAYCIEVKFEVEKQFARGSTLKTITKEEFAKFCIPVPPLEVQCEIVRILDNFTLLSAELSAELSARKKQYQYYLDSIYENIKDNNVNLGSIGSFTRGKRFVHADVVDEGVPCIHYGELYTFYGVHANKVKSHIKEELRSKMRYANKNDVIIVGAGENRMDIGIGVAWEGDEDVAVHDACYTLKHNQNPKYISYFLRTSQYHNQIKKFVYEGKICSISAEGLKKAIIPIPSIEEQNKIVNILEKFDDLCNDISEGLPAEIEARKKQYEYYRDKLLTFKELKS